MKVSVILPSRLQRNPCSGELWLQRAVNSVWNQTIVVRGGFQVEVVVGLDSGAVPPPVDGVRWAFCPASGQAGALNAAVAASTGDILTFLEDDDYWLPNRLGWAFRCFRGGGFLTSNQREILPNGEFVRINDFATPSGWILERRTWEILGDLDVTYRYHLDNEYLGRVREKNIPRLHLVEKHAISSGRRWLAHIRKFTAICELPVPSPIVDRTMNPEGGVEKIKTDESAARISTIEYQRLVERYKTVPW